MEDIMFNLDENEEKKSFFTAAKELSVYAKGQVKNIFIAMIFVMLGSVINVITPFIIGDISKKYIPTGDKEMLLTVVLALLVMYLVDSISSYFQIYVMGRVGQRILYNIRHAIFSKIQSLPLEFFNSNKSGDLISRVNNDTERLNQAFSETLLRFVGNIFIMVGIGIAMILLNPLLGLMSLAITITILLITSLSSTWIKSKNKEYLKATGALSAEIQESLSNFKVVIAFNRRDYFRNAFEEANKKNQKSATWAGIANGILTPIYDFGGALALFLVYLIGIELIINGELNILGLNIKSSLEFGTLISYILYINQFYTPLRSMAALFASIQTSLASWTRISNLLATDTNIKLSEDKSNHNSHPNNIIEFKEVSFGYTKEHMVLKHLNFEMEKGKTYALVGPTGGGKSTTASLIARLYDTTEGEIVFDGRDIKSFNSEELSKSIGFILQEPFLFTGKLSENIKYGNDEIKNFTDEQLLTLLKEMNIEKVIDRFNDGLDTSISNNAENISLGQKQLIAFVRALLRKPKLLILDEATANIDTMTEHLLQEIINKLPSDTTKIIIAHRLNTIEKADQIFFISNGTIEKPMDFKSALGLIENTKSKS